MFTLIVREVDVWTLIASTPLPRYSYWETFPLPNCGGLPTVVGFSLQMPTLLPRPAADRRG